MLEVQQNSEEEATGQFIPLQSNLDLFVFKKMSFRLTLRAMRIDHSRMPNMNPLYWKCMWSTMRNPGCRNRDAEIMRCIGGSAAPRMNLSP